MVALYTVWYNFVKMHKTLRRSQAMAGVADRLWSRGMLPRWSKLRSPSSASVGLTKRPPQLRSGELSETAAPPKKRKSGIPTGNAGEYFVMGELLRRGFDAQLADRNTQGYDLLVGSVQANALEKIQVKSVRSAPWYVKLADFRGAFLNRITIYVLIGNQDGKKPVRFFIAKNLDLELRVHRPESFESHAFMPLRAVEPFEGRWDILPGYLGQISN